MDLTNLMLSHRRQWLVMLGVLIMSMTVNAQITVKGTVVDEQGEPLIGATVMVKGSSQGTATDLDGNYTLINVNAKATLAFSYVGYNSVEEAVNNRTVINVTMSENSTQLGEVVVVGYGSLEKKEVSSSIVQINRDEFQQGGMNNAMEMLTGKVAGLNVATTAGANPNGSSDIQVRGASSISASNGPLIVIDGIAGGDIRNLASQDIESMTVLKDAASAAIYGTRGANGVILITTRRGTGTEGVTSVTYDSYFSMNFARNKPDVLSADEFRRSRRSNDYGYSTDWYDEITRDYGYDINQYLALDGTTRNGSYNASINYKNARGLDIVSKREEYGARLSVQQRAVNNHLTFTIGLNGRKVKETWGNDGMFDTALTLNPTMPVFNEDGSYFQPTTATGIRNPVSELKLNDSQGNRTYLLGNADIKYDIWHNSNHSISTQLSYSLHYNDLKSDYYTPSTAGESFWNGYKGRASITYQKWWTNRVEWLANYSWVNDANQAKLMVGYNWERSMWEQMFEENSDFTFDNSLWHGIGSGSYLKDGMANMYAGKSESTLIGFFGRINWNWKNLLMAAASIRYEGSTKFGKDHKWGAFPSASIAWEIANMEFMHPYTDIVQSLKPRFSYGVTGRSDFDAYKSIATYSPNGSYLFDGSWVNGYAPSSNPNPNLGWEKLTSVNVGVDFVLWNRVRGSVEYFDRRSNDLLYNYTAPQPPYVYPTILVNVGTTKNTGVEVAVDADVFTGTPVTWTTGVNYSYGTTKLTKLSNDIYQAAYLDLYQKPGVGTSEYFFRVEEGGQIAQFFGYKTAGVDENGTLLIYNADDEVIPVTQGNPDDKRNIGNGAPRHFLSWNNTVRYGNWDLGVQFSGAFDYKIFNMRRYGMGLEGCGSDNVLRSAYLDEAAFASGGVISDYFLENGDYFKLQNVTLGYTFPFKGNKIIDSLRLYLAAKNLFTITSHKGNDPSTVPSTGITPGIDSNSAYPYATSVTFGVTFRFK